MYPSALNTVSLISFHSHILSNAGCTSCYAVINVSVSWGPIVPHCSPLSAMILSIAACLPSYTGVQMKYTYFSW